MVETSFCEVCGNEITATLAICPFCQSQRTARFTRRGIPKYRIVNLEKGMPTIEQALQRLRHEITFTAQQECRALVLIHGYGSSGQGGAIKKEVHRQLGFMLDNRQINDFLPGEECNLRLGHGLQMVQRFPFLKRYLRNRNPGISIVIV